MATAVLHLMYAQFARKSPLRIENDVRLMALTNFRQLLWRQWGSRLSLRHGRRAQVLLIPWTRKEIRDGERLFARVSEHHPGGLRNEDGGASANLGRSVAEFGGAPAAMHEDDLVHRGMVVSLNHLALRNLLVAHHQIRRTAIAAIHLDDGERSAHHSTNSALTLCRVQDQRG